MEEYNKSYSKKRKMLGTATQAILLQLPPRLVFYLFIFREQYDCARGTNETRYAHKHGTTSPFFVAARRSQA